MSDREKLIELISTADFEPVKGVVRTIGSRFTTSFIERIADHLIANGVTVQKWIPVTERLPEDRGDVLAVVYWHEKWRVKMAWCAQERNKWSVHVGFADRDDVTVTHWMPLPEPPEEGE